MNWINKNKANILYKVINMNEKVRCEDYVTFIRGYKFFSFRISKKKSICIAMDGWIDESLKFGVFYENFSARNMNTTSS